MKLIEKKVGILWANLHSSNLGVSALAYSTLIIFEEIGRRKNIKFDYTLIGGQNINETIRLGLNEIVVKEHPMFLGGDMIRYIKNLIRRPTHFLHYRYLHNLKNMDIIVDTGEGDSYSDIYGTERFRHFDYVKRLFRMCNMPYILLPQTIGPFISEEAIKKAKLSLSHTDMIFARDKQSFDYSREISPKSNIQKTIDMAFFLPYEENKMNDDDKLAVGVNVSGLLWEGGYTKNNQFGLKDSYKITIKRILDYLTGRDDITIHLIGHVLGKPEDIDEDMHVLNEINKEYPKTIIAPFFKTPIDAKSYIAKMDFFTGARMHACIAAISSGVPVLPMAYSRKFNGLFTDSLKYPYLADLTVITSNEALDRLKEMLSKLDLIKKDIEDIYDEIIQVEKEKMIESLTKCII